MSEQKVVVTLEISNENSIPKSNNLSIIQKDKIKSELDIIEECVEKTYNFMNMRKKSKRNYKFQETTESIGEKFSNKRN